MEYIAYLHKDKNSDFGVSFPDLPGCATAGRTLEEARRMAAEALQLHLAEMLEDGTELPDPSTLDQLAGDPAMRGAVAFLVQAEAPEKTVRVNVTARESQLQTIDRLARKHGMTRSAYMVQSAIGVEGGRRAAKR
ncbi:MAG TPA: type II toxin-antitoxin system HicB family antitoxin [Acidobacteriaceae bacterium]|nr:type II toxin-antitoxin system HicB family antitoxin [Acidobacteriaceae bacterium]